MKSLFCRSILINRSKYTPSNWKHPRNLDRKHWNYSSMRTELWTSNEPNHVRPFKKLCMFVLLKTYVWHLAFIKYLVNFLSFISLQRRSKGLGRKPYPFTTGEVCDRKKYPDFHKKQSEQERINTSRLHWFHWITVTSGQQFYINGCGYCKYKSWNELIVILSDWCKYWSHFFISGRY